MVKELQKNKEKKYQCEECKLYYLNREWAEKCEAWCRAHHSCNLEIIEHAHENEEFETVEKY